MLFAPQRSCQGIQHHLGEVGGFLLVTAGFDQYAKLIPPQSGDYMPVFQRHGQAGRHIPQHAVAYLVAVAVVDVFEMVQVEKQQSHLVVALPGRLQGLPAAPVKQSPVGQAGQRVMVRLEFEILLDLLQLEKLGTQAGGHLVENL